MNISLIEALLQEKKGLAARGLKERIKAVDEQLASLGYKEVASIEPEVEVATAPKPRRRKVS